MNCTVACVSISKEESLKEVWAFVSQKRKKTLRCPKTRSMPPSSSGSFSLEFSSEEEDIVAETANDSEFNQKIQFRNLITFVSAQKKKRKNVYGILFSKIGSPEGLASHELRCARAHQVEGR